MTENYIDCSENNSGSEILKSPECEKMKSLIFPHLKDEEGRNCFIDYLYNWAGLFEEDDIKSCENLKSYQDRAIDQLLGFIRAFRCLGLLSFTEHGFCWEFLLDYPNLLKKYAA